MIQLNHDAIDDSGGYSVGDDAGVVVVVIVLAILIEVCLDAVVGIVVVVLQQSLVTHWPT